MIGSRSERLVVEDDEAVAWKTELIAMKRANHHDKSSCIVVNGTVVPIDANGGVAGHVEDTVSSGASNRFGQEPHKTSERKTHGEAKGTFLTVVRVMFSTLQSSSLFAAVLLSGMAGGVIDIFLFIR